MGLGFAGKIKVSTRSSSKKEVGSKKKEERNQKHTIWEIARCMIWEI